MFVTFLPLYLADVFHLNIKEVAFSAWVPYVGAALGSVAGGWYSGWLINRGKTVNNARKAAMLIGGFIIIPSILAAIMSTAKNLLQGSGCHSLYGTGIGRLPVLHDELADHSERFA